MARLELSDEKKAELFLDLGKMSLYEAGVKYGYDKYYSTAASVKGKVHQAYTEVRDNPEHYGLNDENVKLVTEIVSGRSGSSEQMKLREKLEADVDEDVRSLTLKGRKKALMLLHKKMDYMLKSPKMLKKERLTNLSTAFGVLFDKSQIIKGEATEHVAVMGKIDKDMDPQKALDAVMKIREANLEAKDRKKK